MSRLIIRKVAVLGAGVMGAQIAAHCANAGVPVILFGKEFWQHAFDLDYLAEQGTISPGDQDIIDFVDSADEAWGIISRFYNL